MAIDLSRYVQITSGVGAASSAAVRELIPRLNTTNPLLPTGGIATFGSAKEVGDYFGTTSQEYLRAVFAFGWISKSITNVPSISFARWVDAAAGSRIYGQPRAFSLGNFTSISSGAMTLTLGGVTLPITGVNLSGAASLAAVAALIQAAIRAQTGGGVAWTAATVTYDPVRGSFNFVSGTTGPDTIQVAAGAGTDVAGPLGWLTGAILSNGAAVQTISEFLTASTNISNNFGSFAFMPSLTLNQVIEAATWNNSQENNVQFMYSVPVTPANAAGWSAALIGIGGTTLTLALPSLPNEYPEMDPMLIMGATDYTQPNAVQNYMFQVFNQTPTVTTDLDANLYDNLRINYYGQTQTAGNLIQFYQRGFMMGLPVDPVDQNTYANEEWLKAQLSADLMSLLLAVPTVGANRLGQSQVLAILQSGVNRALDNGVISVGRPLTDVQRLYITNATNDNKAWRQVENIGYWLGVRIESYVANGVTQWKATYTLIYTKADAIRKIEGTDILI